MIAAYYNLSYVTVDIFSMSLTEKTKLKGLLEIVSSASEFEHIPIRHKEELFLKKLYDRVPVKLATADYESPHFKTNVLLQAHFARLNLPPDLAADQALILTKVLKYVVAFLLITPRLSYADTNYVLSCLAFYLLVSMLCLPTLSSML